MSAAKDLLQNYQHIIEDLTLVTGASGIFDVEVDGEMLFSKDDCMRHANVGEVLKLFAEQYAVGALVYGS